MQITRQADYALRAVIFLSRLNGDQKASTSFIAEKQQIPPSFLAKIVSQLSIAGLIQTSARRARRCFPGQTSGRNFGTGCDRSH